MRRAALCFASILFLGLAANASAKGVVAAEICGASGCREVKDERDMMALNQGEPTDSPRAAGAFYRAELTVMGGEDQRFTFSVDLLPRAGLMRGENDDGTFSWVRVWPASLARQRRLTRGLEPFAPARLHVLGPAEPPWARMDEVVQIADDSTTGAAEAPSASADEAPAWPWIAGGVAVLAALRLLLRPRLGRPSTGPV